MQIEFILDPEDAIREKILTGLRQYNFQFFPHDNSQNIACIARNEHGEFCGGLFGEIYINTLFVEYLWVDESKREAGLGSSLFKRVEQEVKALGVETVCLDTFSFQAREFYIKQGFKEVGRFTNFPMPGVDKIFLQKQFD
ncbi:GNAT family N-acetyltransferase [Vibrio taketomensis]|uniref:GNAT family N-acetyltransferase n=1 Tax=Vibrio taketomensis TaxID=2572923 RepID=UPI00138A2F9B|nr:GNAT family N-acetyltransferase [Vibrio taketomensis]